MTIAELKKLVPPPAKPFDVGTLAQWRSIEDQLGAHLPGDYRAFVFAYGSGLFANLYCVFNPFSAYEGLGLLPCVKRVLGTARELRASGGDDYCPYPLFPEAGGLLPWGCDENGNEYFWRTKGPPARWAVVQNNVRGRGFQARPYTMTAYLGAVLTRKVKALASGYPRKDVYKFEPWDTSRF